MTTLSYNEKQVKMTTLLDLPDDIWEYFFHQGYLKLGDMVKLSQVCSELYQISHGISTFSSLNIDPFCGDQQRVISLKMVFVKAWRNIAFLRYFPTPIYGVKPNFHYIFHTWNDSPNVYFHLFSTRWINFDEIVKKYPSRVYHYSCKFDEYSEHYNIPYLKLCGNVKSEKFNLNWGVKKVSIGFSDIRDLSPFRNLRELIIRLSSDIDIETLKGSRLKKLELRDCDINSLEGVQGIRTVIIDGKSRIKDFSPVSKTPYLTILGNKNLRHLEFVKQVRELDISSCSNILDVSYLTQVSGLRKLTAKHCNWAVGFGELRKTGIEVITG